MIGSQMIAMEDVPNSKQHDATNSIIGQQNVVQLSQIHVTINPELVELNFFVTTIYLYSTSLYYIPIA